MARLVLTVALLLMAQLYVISASPDASVAAGGELESRVVDPIDQRILERLSEDGITPSPASSDAEFLRRITQTTIGQLPTPDEVRDFLDDDRLDKRQRKIDELLGHPLHAAMWATRFCEMTGNADESLEGPDELKPRRAKMWHDWLRRRFADNTPYDELVRAILTATSRTEGESPERWIDQEAALVHAAKEGFDAAYADKPALELAWRRGVEGGGYPSEEMAERVASNFMGVRIGCAKCHPHPFDKWTQQDYRAFANVFSQVRFDLSPEVREAIADRLDERRSKRARGEALAPPLPRLSEVYLAEKPHMLLDEASGDPLPAKALGGPVLEPAACVTGSETINSGVVDFRARLMDWLGAPDNPYFARNIVNRVWSAHFGYGLVEPLDGFSTTSSPMYEALLQELADDFVEHDYDLRRLERLILNSSTWQASSTPNDTNRTDRRDFARAYVRMPPPHAVADMWHMAVDVPHQYGDGVPAGSRAVEIAPSRLKGTRWETLLELFGRNQRLQACDCTPPPGPSIRKTLALMCDSTLLNGLPLGRASRLSEAELSDKRVVDELFLSTLSRFPDAEERDTAEAHLASAADRSTACEDLLWSLINTQEFITIH